MHFHNPFDSFAELPPPGELLENEFEEEMRLGEILDKVEEFSDSVLSTLALLDGGGGESKRRRKRQEGEEDDSFWQFCERFTQLHEVLLELKDGSMFSFAKIKHKIDTMEETVLAFEGATKENIFECYETETWLKDMTERTVKMVVNKLAHWIKVKRFPDEFSIAEDSECEYGYNEEDMEGEYPCNCECKRKNKVCASKFLLSGCTKVLLQVKIYKMFRILSMLDDTKIERVGDVLEWVFRSAVKVIYQVIFCPNFANDN